MKNQLVSLFTENWSYKLISFFIALILWLTILGRRDIVVSRHMEIELITAPGIQVMSQSSEQVKLKVSGSSTALRRFVENGVSQILTLDLSDKGPGEYEIEIPRARVDLPFGVRLLSMSPTSLILKLEKK